MVLLGRLKGMLEGINMDQGQILKDNEGSDIYTEDELKDWDSTLMDGLENEKWEEQPKGVPVYFDPETKRPYIIEEDEEEELEDEDLIEPEIEVKMSGEPSLEIIQEHPQLTEEEKKWDYDGDGILSNEERTRYDIYKAEAERFFKNQSISSDAKQRMRDYLDGKTKRYF